MAEVVPTGDRIKVLPLRVAETTRSGRVLIPDSAREVPMEGIVLAIGRGKLLDSGVLVPLEVEVGDIVSFGRYAGIYVFDEDLDIECIFMRDEEVLARQKKSELPPVHPLDPRVTPADVGAV